MKRWSAVAIVAAILVVALAGTVLAQGTTPPTSDYTCPCGAAVGSAPMGGGMWGSDVRGGRGMPDWAGSDEVVQQVLGMTAEEIQAERLAGKSLAEMAQDKGITEEALIAAIMDAKRADLDALVEAGKLTQAQADLMLDHMDDQVQVMVERTFVGPMWQQDPQGQSQGQNLPSPMQGGRGGRGGMMSSRWSSTR